MFSPKNYQDKETLENIHVHRVHLHVELHTLGDIFFKLFGIFQRMIMDGRRERCSWYKIKTKERGIFLIDSKLVMSMQIRI